MHEIIQVATILPLQKETDKKHTLTTTHLFACSFFSLPFSPPFFIFFLKLFSMMPPDNTPPPSTKDQENSDGKKITTKPTPEHGIKCPRCDSPNTKFCYYNNYSLTQPRHFCKTCRRYWTNGGALRNVSIGGGCRKKNKKVKTSSSSSTSSLSILSYDYNKDSASSSSRSSSQFRFFHGLNLPSLEFQLGGLLPFHHHHHQPSFTTGIYNNQFSSIEEVSNSNTLSASSFPLDPSGGGGNSNSLMGLNYPSLSRVFNGGNAIQGMNLNSSLASSIESLSSINQDLHLKLQQQRLATMFGGDNVNQKEEGSSSVSLSTVNLENLQTLKPQPLLFQNLEISKPEMVQDGNNSRKEGTSGGDAPPTMEWFFGNSNYCSVSTPAATTNGSVGNHYDNANNNWSNGVHGWGNVQQQHSALP